MITLVVFATLAATVMAAGQYALKQNTRLKEQQCGTWLADNHLSELQLGALPAIRRHQMNQYFDGRNWKLRQDVSPSADPGLLRVELDVSLADSDRIVKRVTGWINARE